MSNNLDNALRLSLPISKMYERLVVDGSEVFTVIADGSTGTRNHQVNMRKIAQYIQRMLANDPTFKLPISSIIGLGDILNELASAADALEARVAANEEGIADNRTDINWLMTGWVLRVDTWA